MWIWRYLRSRGKDDETGVRNLGLVRAGWLTRSAAPELDQVGALAAVERVKTFVDLRDDLSTAETLKYTRACEAAGVRRLALPLSDKQPVPPDVIRRWLELVRNESLWPLHVHCEGGRHRTGLMCLVFRIEFDRWPFARAYDEAVKFGFYSALGHEPIKDAMLAYVPSWAK